MSLFNTKHFMVRGFAAFQFNHFFLLINNFEVCTVGWKNKHVKMTLLALGKDGISHYFQTKPNNQSIIDQIISRLIHNKNNHWLQSLQYKIVETELDLNQQQ